MINDWRLECFVYVAQTLNFSKAAKALNISQPALTKQIGGLEQTLGVQLFDRTTSKVRLTNEGFAFLDPAMKALDQLHELEGMFRQTSTVTFNYWYRYSLDVIAADFHQRCPQTSLLMIRQKMWGDISATLRKPGNVVFGRQNPISSHDDGVFLPIATAPFCAFLPPDSPLARYSSLTMADIPEDVVIIRSGASLSTRDINEPGVQLERMLGDRRFVGCNSLDEMIGMVAAHCGIAFGWTLPNMRSESVTCVPFEALKPEEVGIGYLRRNETESLRSLVVSLANMYRDNSITPLFA